MINRSCVLSEANLEKIHLYFTAGGGGGHIYDLGREKTLLSLPQFIMPKHAYIVPQHLSMKLSAFQTPPTNVNTTFSSCFEQISPHPMQ